MQSPWTNLKQANWCPFRVIPEADNSRLTGVLPDTEFEYNSSFKLVTVSLLMATSQKL